MKKFNTLISMLVLFAGITSAQSSYSRGHEGAVTFTENTVQFEQFGGAFFDSLSAPFAIKDREGATFLDVAGRRYLILLNESVLFLANSKNEVFMGFNGESGFHESACIPGNVYISSSYLKEGTTNFYAGNMHHLKPNRPWIEGEVDDGTGVEIKVSWDIEISSLLIVNGFVSYDNPSLFTKNNRVKRVRISDTSGYNYELILADSMNPQIVELARPTSGVEMRILETYKGSKYNDTCISLINGIIGPNSKKKQF